MKLLSVILLCLTSFSVWADAATVVAIRGEVFSDKMSLAQGLKVDEGDTITAMNRSFAVLSFTDGSKVTIRPNTVVKITAFSYEEGHDDVQFDLLAGGLRVVTGAIAKHDPEDYRVQTPVALLGVRGTTFSIQLVENAQEIDENGGF